MGEHSNEHVLSPVQLFASPWTIARQAALSMETSSQEHWSGLLFPSPLSRHTVLSHTGFPDGPDGKESACRAGDLGLIPGSRRSPREGNGTHSSILTWRIPWTEEPGGL